MAEKVALQIRLSSSTHRKLKHISDFEVRSLNAQMEYFIMKGIREFEKENGEIDVSRKYFDE